LGRCPPCCPPSICRAWSNRLTEECISAVAAWQEHGRSTQQGWKVSVG
jgi:hypothetical protein